MFPSNDLRFLLRGPSRLTEVRERAGQITVDDLTAVSWTGVGPMVVGELLAAKLGDNAAAWSFMESTMGSWEGDFDGLVVASLLLSETEPFGDLEVIPAGLSAGGKKGTPHMVAQLYAAGLNTRRDGAAPAWFARAAWRFMARYQHRKILEALLTRQRHLPEGAADRVLAVRDSTVRALWLGRWDRDRSDIDELWPDDTTRAVSAARAKLAALTGPGGRDDVRAVAQRAADIEAAVSIGHSTGYVEGPMRWLDRDKGMVTVQKWCGSIEELTSVCRLDGAEAAVLPDVAARRLGRPELERTLDPLYKLARDWTLDEASRAQAVALICAVRQAAA